MRLLVVSDVHSNAPAFEAVLRDAKRRGYDDALFLGDLFGYYPFPNECAALLRQLAPAHALFGNHDAVLSGLLVGDVDEDRREDSMVVDVLRRQLPQLESAAVEVLGSLREEAHGDGWQAAHGAFRNRFEYLNTLSSAQANLPYLEAPVGLVGHTHVPKVFASVRTEDGTLWRTVTFVRAQGHYRVPPRARAFLNPGSVGQPRDGISSASYGIYDTDSQGFDVYRVEYDMELVQQAVLSAGYPTSLSVRLNLGR